MPIPIPASRTYVQGLSVTEDFVILACVVATQRVTDRQTGGQPDRS